MEEVFVDQVELFVFDFDGVLTNNLVLLSETGAESVICSRSDGLAFKGFKRLSKKVLILSSEKNVVVTLRAKKLEVECIQGVSRKEIVLKNYVQKNNIRLNQTFYIGNDINDLNALTLCGYSACPSDSHPLVKEKSKILLKSKGGFGVAREILEEVLKQNLYELVYN